MEPSVKEWEASFTLGSVLWVTVSGGTVYLDGDGREGAGMGAGLGWRDEFRFERAETDMPVGHLEIPRWH